MAHSGRRIVGEVVDLLVDTVAFEDHRQDLDALNAALVLPPERTAALTIDMHRGHLDPVHATMPLPTAAAASVVANTGRFLEALRAVGIPIVHVVAGVRPEEAGRISPRFSEGGRVLFAKGVVPTPAMTAGTRHNVLGSIQCELMPELGPVDGDRIVSTKKTLSSFLGTDLDLLLRRWLPAENLIIVGVNTNTCVQLAAFEALNRGYRVVVPSDCVASMYGDDLHHAALHNIARCLGWVLPSRAILQKLREDG
jgi:nicotinamidase-related amidase